MVELIELAALAMLVQDAQRSPFRVFDCDIIACKVRHHASGLDAEPGKCNLGARCLDTAW